MGEEGVEATAAASAVEVHSESSARKALLRWLEQRHGHLHAEVNWSRWDYGGRPFWAVVAVVDWCSPTDWFSGIYGFHIHENGEVIKVGKIAIEKTGDGDDRKV